MASNLLLIDPYDANLGQYAFNVLTQYYSIVSSLLDFYICSTNIYPKPIFQTVKIL